MAEERLKAVSMNNYLKEFHCVEKERNEMVAGGGIELRRGSVCVSLNVCDGTDAAGRKQTIQERGQNSCDNV